jgi:maltose O-acetyltransferase
VTVEATIWESGRRHLQRNGLRAAINSAWEVLRAHWQLRRSNRVGSTRLRGIAYVSNRGNLTFGDRVRLNGRVYPLQFACMRGAHLEIGEGTFINHGADISAKRSVTIGQNCNIGQFAIIIDSDYHDVNNHHLPGKTDPIVIEDDVWLGARVTVLRGSHIGRGSVVAAHAVVSGNIPPYSLVGGVPGRVIRSLRDGETDA